MSPLNNQKLETAFCPIQTKAYWYSTLKTMQLSDSLFFPAPFITDFSLILRACLKVHGLINFNEFQK